MRACLAFASVAFLASPALAQQPQQPAPARSGPVEVQRALADPATADKLARMMQAMSKAFLNLPVGEIEAAAEGRAPTEADRRKTVLSEGRKDDPAFERDVQAMVANSRPMIEGSMKALAASLPAMIQGMTQMSKELEKAAENMPRPNYPKQ